MAEVTTTKVEELNRYEAHIGDDRAGLLEHVLDDGVITFTHTEVGDAFGGRGVGSALVRDALNDVRATGGLRVVAECPFVKAWIDKHPDYADLLG
jgi:predicted GNAT family acetyltransferase